MEEVSRHAARLFRKKGYLATTMNDIAKSMKIKKGSLYYYTSDKESLLFDILNSTMDEMLKNQKEIESQDTSPDKRFANAIRTHIINAVDYIDQFSVLLHDTQHLSSAKKRIILEKRKEYEDIFIKCFDDCKSNGIFKEVNGKIAVYCVLGSCNWLYQWFDAKGSKKPEEIADIFLSIFFGGMLQSQ